MRKALLDRPDLLVLTAKTVTMALTDRTETMALMVPLGRLDLPVLMVKTVTTALMAPPARKAPPVRKVLRESRSSPEQR